MLFNMASTNELATRLDHQLTHANITVYLPRGHNLNVVRIDPAIKPATHQHALSFDVTGKTSAKADRYVGLRVNIAFNRAVEMKTVF